MSDEPAVTRNRDALAAHLDNIGVRGSAYHLFGAHPDGAIVMDQRPEGWVVFYSERGGEYSLRVHFDEAGACADLLSRLVGDAHVFFELVAGPAPVAEADAAFDEWLRQRGVTRGDMSVFEWKYDDVPWVSGPYWRRYFVQITTIRRLRATR